MTSVHNRFLEIRCGVRDPSWHRLPFGTKQTRDSSDGALLAALRLSRSPPKSVLLDVSRRLVTAPRRRRSARSLRTPARRKETKQVVTMSSASSLASIQAPPRASRRCAGARARARARARRWSLAPPRPLPHERHRRVPRRRVPLRGGEGAPREDRRRDWHARQGHHRV